MYSETTLALVSQLCDEVKALAATVEAERKEDYFQRSYHRGYTKASAALRRRSMDLTRALAELRKPR